MSSSEQHHHGVQHVHATSPTDLFRHVIMPNAADNIAQRLNIVTTMRTLMSRQPSPDMVQFIRDQLQVTHEPQVRAFMQLIISDEPRYRLLAEEGLKLLESKLQEDEVRERQDQEREQAVRTVTETTTRALEHPTQSETAAPVRTTGARGGEADMMAALKGFTTPSEPALVVAEKPADPAPMNAKVLPFIQPTPTPQLRPWSTPQEGVQSISIPTTEDLKGPRNHYSYISSTVAVDAPIRSVAGLVVGIKGQMDVEHGFGFYMPLPPGRIVLDYTGQTRNVIRIAMGSPETIILFDDHRGPHYGGVSNFFTIVEAMRDGYRFLMDLEIIPLNGRYALSIQDSIGIDRLDANKQPAFISSAHLNKLAHACAAIGFHAFTGEVDRYD